MSLAVALELIVSIGAAIFVGGLWVKEFVLFLAAMVHCPIHGLGATCECRVT